MSDDNSTSGSSFENKNGDEVTIYLTVDVFFTYSKDYY